MSIAGALLMELEQEAKATQRVLEQVPEAKLAWRPHPKSMSLGQLAMHVASTPGSVAQMATVDRFDMPSFSQKEPASRKEILDAMAASIAAAKAALQGMDDARMMGTWTMIAGGQQRMAMPRIGLLRAIMLNHWYHHRGQLTVYLRLLDVKLPSVYGPTADENPFG